MKPDWDTLMDEFKDSKSALIADVDCTADGKALCERHDVRGYPTIKHGDPEDLKDYNGGRDLAAFKKFAEENLGPTCGVENLDLCDDESKALIEKFQQLDDAELDKTIEDADGKLAKIDDASKKVIVNKFQAKIDILTKEVEAATKKKEDTVAKETKKTGLRMMKAVLADKKKKDEGSDKKKGKKKNKK